MPSQWIVRVEGKEYGPVDLEQLQEWKREGRVIRENEVREFEGDRWFPAAELVELFGEEPPRSAVEPAATDETSATLGRILGATVRIYVRGFWRYLGLTALVLVPSICAQLTTVAAPAAATDLDLRTTMAGMFNFAMLMVGLFAWPLYIAGLQLLTSDLVAGHWRGFRELVTGALTFWSRVAGLCLVVYGAFFLLMMLGFGILLTLLAVPGSIVLAVASLLLLALQVWMFSRVFLNVLFWQQAAVLENAGVVASLRRSMALVRSRQDQPWWRRPAWQGAAIASLWCLVAMALTIPPEWGAAATYFHALTTSQDPQAILQSIGEAAKPAAVVWWALGLNILQAILRPLLGIAFVLLYFSITGRRIEPAAPPSLREIPAAPNAF